MYHGNKEETTLTRVIFEHPPPRPKAYLHAKYEGVGGGGGQKFSFPTFLDSYREVLLNTFYFPRV